MKNKIYLFLAAWLLLGLAGCEKAVIDRPNPFEKKSPPEIVLNFTYREVPNGLGQVAFTNRSKGFQSYFWDFGFKNKDGVQVTSRETSMRLFYPANGEYLVILRGIDLEGAEHEVHQFVKVALKTN